MSTDLIEQLISGAPLASKLGIRFRSADIDRAQLELPFDGSNVTIADIVHGGAISALIDTAATAAAWSLEELPENPRGTTIALTVNFLAAARDTDLIATAKVIRRGRTICYVDIDVTTPEGDPIAKGLVTYKLG